MTETYEGWSNRETWCANLWLANDEGLYNMVREWAGEAWDESADADYVAGLDAGWDDVPNDAAHRLAAVVQGFFDGLAVDIIDAPDDDRVHVNSEARRMVLDIGSLYRVDWHEIATSWVSDHVAEMDAN